MGHVIVLSGISGAGKSTLAQKLQAENAPAAIVSADHYFMKDGKYEFNYKELTAAHASCFREFIGIVMTGLSADGQYSYENVIVDNTNILAWEISPYMLAATAYGWTAEIITLMCPESLAVSRNVHGVDKRTINNQLNKLLRRWLPKGWKETKVEWNG